MEHIIHSHIMKHSDKDQTLSETQHSFRKFCSCETQLLETINNISSSINKREQVDSILLDFSKASDKVCHYKLLLKLDHYGIKGNIHKWISNFLQNQTQLQYEEDFQSVSVLSGVPQGTVTQVPYYSHLLMMHTFIDQFPLVKMQTPYKKIQTNSGNGRKTGQWNSISINASY